MERTAKALGTQARKVVPRIEPRLRNAEPVPDGTTAISVGLDRTAVPMEEPHAAGENPPTRRKQRRKSYERKPPQPVDVNYRMAYVGTVSFYNADGEKLASRCYAAAAHESPTEQIVTRMMADLRGALRQVPKLAVGAVQDGAPEMCNLLQSHFPASVFGRVEQGIDFWHVIEKLAPAADLLFGADHAKPELDRWRVRLRCANSAADENGMFARNTRGYR